MGFELFPEKMKNFTASDSKTTLKFIRVGLVVLSVIILVEILFSNLLFFVTFQGISAILTTAYFGLTAGYYLNSKLKKQKNQICVLFLICWAVNWTAVIYNQMFVKLGVDVDTWVLAAAITADYIYNKIWFVRPQYIFPLGVIAIYVLIFFGISVIYHGFSLFVWLEALIVTLVAGIVALEAGRFIKVRKCGETDEYRSLV